MGTFDRNYLGPWQGALGWRCGASVAERNAATAHKNPAFGGPNRPVGEAGITDDPVATYGVRIDGNDIQNVKPQAADAILPARALNRE